MEIRHLLRYLRCISFTLIFAFIPVHGSSINDPDTTAARFLEHINARSIILQKKGTVYQIASIENLTDPADGQIIGFAVHLFPQGFLIMPAGQARREVIAYSLSQNWKVDLTERSVFNEILINNLRKSREEITQAITKKQQNYSSVLTQDQPFYQWPPEGSTWTTGWVETAWIQGSPYNDLCPIDPICQKRCAAGCIVTAMAQVINYHKYLGGLRFGKADQYDSFERKIKIDADSLRFSFPGFSELNLYLAGIEYKYKENIQLSDKDKAVLCFSCGIALKIDYTGAASSVLSVSKLASPIKDKMKYFSADYQLAYDENFYDILKNNLMNGMPAIILLTDHAIIADGFNTDGFFHLNFGWCSGNPDYITNTWYKTDMLPKNYEGFYSGILNIQPVDFDYHPEITGSQGHIRFPCIRLGEKSGYENLTIKNTGTSPVTIDDILISEYFEMLQPAIKGEELVNKIILQPEEELILYVRCIPGSLGQISGQIQIFASYQDVLKYLAIGLTGYGTTCEGTSVNADYVSGIWQKKGSPYFICNDLCIPSNERLEIEAGSEIIFMGKHQFIIDRDAQLLAKGSVSDSIHFFAFDRRSGWYGLLFRNSNNESILDYCVIRDVNAPFGKSAIYISECSPTILHTSIMNNQSLSYGAGILMYLSSASISHVRLSDNCCLRKYSAGALYMRKSDPTLKNLLVCNNQAINGAAIYSSKSSPSIINLTIANNRAEESGGAIMCSDGNCLKIKNSLFWNNDADLGTTFAFKKSAGNDTLVFSYSDIDTSTANWLFVEDPSDGEIFIIWDKGNICHEPLFSDPGQLDFTLQSASPCIDSGDPNDDYGLEPQPNGGRINMGTYGGTAQAAVSGVATDVADRQPGIYYLAQNYPNPFNPITTINYELGTTNDVELTIYNLLGQKVATLVDQKQAAGRYHVQWDASGFASGVYYYRLCAGSFVETKKLVLLR